MVRWLMGISAGAVISAAAIGWYLTYDYVHNGWREFKIVCMTRMVEVQSSLKPEFIDLFARELQDSFPSAGKIAGNRIFLRPYVHLFNPQFLGKLSIAVMAKKLNISEDKAWEECRELAGVFVQDPDPIFSDMNYEDDNEWLRVLTFYSLQDGAHRISGTPPWIKSD